MPFTPTHIAAVLPIAWLSGWRLPFSALAIGSLVCDIPVFFPWLMDYWKMHSLEGLLSHCLPIGLLMYAAFHWIYKRPLASLLPKWIGQRCQPLVRQQPPLTLQHWLITAVCIFVGASTHVLWDSFTHVGRWGVELFPVLNEIVIQYPPRPIAWFSVLQHGSSVVFLPLMALLAWRWLQRQPVTEVGSVANSFPGWAKGLTVVGLLLIPLLSFYYVVRRYPGAPNYFLIHEAVKLSGLIVISSVVIYGVGVFLLQPRMMINQVIED